MSPYMTVNKDFANWKRQDTRSIKVLHRGNRDFLPSLFLWPWPWPSDLHIWTKPVFPGDIPDVQIWTSLRQSFWKLSSDRQTDTIEIIYHTTWVWSQTVYNIQRRNN